jgi:hypothetical protein
MLTLLNIFIVSLVLASQNPVKLTPIHESSMTLQAKGLSGLSQWQNLEINEPLEAFLFEVEGLNETLYQITDLIAPNGQVYVKSNLNDSRPSGYEIPQLRNEISKNRSLSVINKFSALLVPNFYTEEKIPLGTWKYRVLSNAFFEADEVKVKVIPSRTRADKRTLRVRIIIDQESYWAENEAYLRDMFISAQKLYSDIGVNLVLQVEPLAHSLPVYDPPNDVALQIVEKYFRDSSNALDGQINFLLLGKMTMQSKPINGISCLSGTYTNSNCFAAMFADPILAHTITPVQAGKILAHELGHYLGLFHTVDKNYMFVGVLHDPFSDTSSEAQGDNIMDPGIHKSVPVFSRQQISVLKKHPILVEE